MADSSQQNQSSTGHTTGLKLTPFKRKRLVGLVDKLMELSAKMENELVLLTGFEDTTVLADKKDLTHIFFALPVVCKLIVSKYVLYHHKQSH